MAKRTPKILEVPTKALVKMRTFLTLTPQQSINLASQINLAIAGDPHANIVNGRGILVAKHSPAIDKKLGDASHRANMGRAVDVLVEIDLTTGEWAIKSVEKA